MSRHTISNDRFDFAFGVDHTPMGAFFQIFDNTWTDNDNNPTGSPAIAADAVFGVQIHHRSAYDENALLRRRINELIYRFKDKTRRNMDEGTVVEVGVALGLPKADLEKWVYQL